MLNFWESDDFSLLSMTEAINTLTVPPQRIGEMGLFKGAGTRSNLVGIEMKDNTLRLIPTQPRGTMPEFKARQGRNLRAVQIPHIPKNSTIIGDDALGVREFGTEDQLESPIQRVNDVLTELKTEHEMTWEYHRLGALQGKIHDADGTSLLLDLFDLFNVTRTTVNWDTTDIGAGIHKFKLKLFRAMQDAMYGVPFRGIQAFVGQSFWDMLTTHPDTRDAFLAQQDNQYAREGAPQGMQFNYMGVIWEEYRGLINTTPFVPDLEAFAFPLGADIYKVAWAPATFIEATNTIGKEYYAKQEAMRFNVGIEVHTQSNPLHYVTKPKALIRLTYSE